MSSDYPVADDHRLPTDYCTPRSPGSYRSAQGIPHLPHEPCGCPRTGY